MKTFLASFVASKLSCLLLGAAAVTFLPLSAASAQTAGPGRISGSLVEAGSSKPVPFSDVLLLRAADSTFVAVAQTSEQGGFKALNLPYGTYLLRVQDINYRVLRRRFNLTASASTIEFPAFEMTAASATRLGEVVVTGEKATVVEELGKRVINVEKDLGSIGGTAANVLQNVPSVSVDVNGTVSMRGTSNLTILIDGKPAGVGNGAVGGPRLDQIPASRIAQVEVITNPSAKYDAAGGGGVINLITKKDHKDGTNGTAALQLGTQDKYAGTLSLNRKQGKVNWQAAYDGRDVTYQSHGHAEQTARLLLDGTPATVRTTQNGIGSERHVNNSLTVGADIELPKNQTLSLSVQPGSERNFETERQVLTQRTNNGPATSTRGQQELDVKVKLLEYSGNYRRTWEQHEGRELTANFGGVVIDANVPVVQRQFAETGSPALAQPGTRQQLKLVANIQFGQVDYVHPLLDGKGRLETGLKLERQFNRGSNAFGYATSESASSAFADDPTRSLTYTFEQVVPAGYVTFQRPLGKKWSTQLGLRGEFTHNGGSIEGGVGIDQRGSLAQDYFNLFPSALISRELGKEAGQNRLQLSYARRLDRPNFMQQLALPIYQDPRSYRLGNAHLTPEYSDNIELGHQLTLGAATLTSTLFARITTDAIQRLRYVDTVATRLAGPGAGLITAETYRNAGTITNLGAEFSLSQPLAKWWRINASTSLYRAQIANNGLGANRQALVGTVRLTNNFTIRPTLDVQLSGNLRSAQITAQGRQLPQGQLDLALRQRLFSDRAALTLRLADVLNTQQNRSEISTDALSSYRYSKDESRVGWLGFTWYIGASKAKPGRIESAPQGGGGFGG
ncbi:outer membrane beta-barrel family protein [Hymenobacter sp. UYCo722]|uniref:outer membrane beta-barrel family protein n=1 Tax=Hymenobacter sp. UYCo722 TaxID=3156335 RepID=UPI00339AB474